MNDDRFANLETMVAFHEDTIQKLNDVVYKQQIKIDKLEERVKVLSQLLEVPGELTGVERGPKLE
ncbi:MAG TPA: SlyX family protein [Deltaproteobacteria bacterium]|nr:SlyX family protein [Deltaproteobacteria bacterium]HOI08156.1 SlyX family protein [Deltaproteobacteria bacterium]